METLLFEFALTCYFAATIVCGLELFKGNKITSRIMFGLVVAGFVLHTANILARYFISGHMPTASLHEASSFFSWCIARFFRVPGSLSIQLLHLLAMLPLPWHSVSASCI